MSVGRTSELQPVLKHTSLHHTQDEKTARLATEVRTLHAIIWWNPCRCQRSEMLDGRLRGTPPQPGTAQKMGQQAGRRGRGDQRWPVRKHLGTLQAGHGKRGKYNKKEITREH